MISSTISLTTTPLATTFIIWAKAATASTNQVVDSTKTWTRPEDQLLEAPAGMATETGVKTLTTATKADKADKETVSHRVTRGKAKGKVWRGDTGTMTI